MGGVITALKAQRKNRKRVSVYLDGHYAFSLPAIEAARLKKGQFLSDEEIEELKSKGEFYKVYNAALRFLSYRPRSEREMRSYLRRKKVSSQLEEAVIEKLKEVGLVDDVAFARFWIENRETFNPSSLHKLRYELLQKGVSEEIISEALKDIDFEESAYRAALKRGRQLQKLEWAAFRKKLGDYLARRGFSYDIIGQVVERVWRELKEDAPSYQ